MAYNTTQELIRAHAAKFFQVILQLTAPKDRTVIINTGPNLNTCVLLKIEKNDGKWMLTLVNSESKQPEGQEKLPEIRKVLSEASISQLVFLDTFMAPPPKTDWIH